MNRNSEVNIEQLAREKIGGKSYSTIREELMAAGMSKEEANKLIRKADERVLHETSRQGSQEKAGQWYRSGLILAVLGLILSIAFNAGIILENLPAILIYSPFFAGILVMIYGRVLHRKHSSPAETGTGAIRKRRPYK